MRDSFSVRFFGVRGSIATAGAATAAVGGNTSCVELTCGDERIILDAGTGLRPLGAELAKLGQVRASLLLSHFHWDHLQGFPFFVPAYVPGNRLAVWGCLDQAGDLDAAVRRALAAQMAPPHFPVGLETMRASLSFHGVRPGGVFQIGSVTVSTASLRHPNGGAAYRLDWGGRSVVYATDTEHDGDSGELDRGLCRLAEGADLLIYDAQYTPEEYRRHVGWGHSTAEEGARLAAAAGVAQLVLFHHDPGHDDWQVARIEAATRARFPGTVAAREGLVIELPAACLAAA